MESGPANSWNLDQRWDNNCLLFFISNLEANLANMFSRSHETECFLSLVGIEDTFLKRSYSSCLDSFLDELGDHLLLSNDSWSNISSNNKEGIQKDTME